MKTRYIVSTLLLILFVFLTGVLFSNKASLSDRRAQEFGEDYARIAVFFPESAKADFSKINEIRTSLDSKLIADSHSSEGRLWYDGFISFGKTSVEDSATSFTAQKIVVGADMLSLLDFDFMSGDRFRSDDNFSDRVVICENLSFRLFGSVNSEGMPLILDGKEWYVAGVIKPEDTKAWSLQFKNEPLVIMPYEIDTETLFSSYEVVMPSPVEHYALDVIKEAVGEGALVVDITERFTLKGIAQNVKTLDERSFVIGGMSFPWYENSARAGLDALSITFLALLINLCALVLCAVYIIVRRKK